MAIAAMVTEVGKKDVITAMLGAAAGLGGFTLVFLGVVISSYQGLKPETMKLVKEPYKEAAGCLLGVFGVSLLVVGLAAAWMVSGQPGTLYTLTIVVFSFELLLIAVAAPYTVYKRLLA